MWAHLHTSAFRRAVGTLLSGIATVTLLTVFCYRTEVLLFTHREDEAIRRFSRIPQVDQRADRGIAFDIAKPRVPATPIDEAI